MLMMGSNANKLSIRQRREMSIDLIQRYYPQFFSSEEVKEYNWHKRNMGVLSMCAAAAIPAQIIVLVSTSGNSKKLKTVLIQSSFFLGILGLGLVACGSMQHTFYRQASAKYLD